MKVVKLGMGIFDSFFIESDSRIQFSNPIRIRLLFCRFLFIDSDSESDSCFVESDSDSFLSTIMQYLQTYAI